MYYNPNQDFTCEKGEYTMKPFSIEDVYDGIFKDEDDILIISDRDFKDQNIVRIIEKCYSNEPDLKGIVFEKCQFKKITFEEITINKPLTFENCYFCGEVLFKKCDFCANLSFRCSTFYRTTVFDDCCYANYKFDFSDIKTEKTCEYFAILNTQHNQKYDTPLYTILNFERAIFNSVVAFNELKDLSFRFIDTV